MKITANGITMNYTLDGPASAPVVTLSHSLAADLSMWDPQMADAHRALPRAALRHARPRRHRRAGRGLHARPACRRTPGRS